METLEEVKEEDELSEEIRKEKTPEELEKEEEEILLRENEREEKRKLKEAKMEVIPEEVIPKEEDVKEEEVKEEEVKEEEKKPMTREEQKKFLDEQLSAFINSDSGKALFQSLGDEKKRIDERQRRRAELQTRKEQQVLAEARQRRLHKSNAPFAQKEEFSPELATFVAERPAVSARSAFFFKGADEGFVLRDVAGIKGFSLFQLEAEKLLAAADARPDAPEEKWFYRDSRGAEHGPFAAHVMRAFYDSRFVMRRTSVRVEGGAWRTVQQYFGDNRMAFVEDVLPDPAAQPVLPAQPDQTGQMTQKGQTSQTTQTTQATTVGKKTPKTVARAVKNHSSLLDPANVYRRPAVVEEAPAEPAKTIHPPAGAISLEAALSLQEQSIEAEETEDSAVVATPVAPISSKIPALSSQDATRVTPISSKIPALSSQDATRVTPTPQPSVEHPTQPSVEPEPVVEPPKSKTPAISPWTKKQLGSKPAVPASDYLTRIGSAVEPTAPRRAPVATTGYVNRIGIALEAQEAEPKRVWRVMPAMKAVPLEELLKQSQTLTMEHERRSEEEKEKKSEENKVMKSEEEMEVKEEEEKEKKTEEREKKSEGEKKKKKEWKPVNLASPAVMRARPAAAAPKCKSIKEIQEEELEKKRAKAKEAEFNTSGGWAR